MALLIQLIFTNFLPFIGVIFYDWTAVAVIVVLWLEATIIWLLYIPRILFAYGHQEDTLKSRISDLAMYFTMGSFMLMMSGVAVYQIFIGQEPEAEPWLQLIVNTVKEFNLHWAIVFITANYLTLLILKYFFSREFLTTSVSDNISDGFLRPGILIVTLSTGGWILQLIKEPIWALILFLLIKVGGELYLNRHMDKATNETQD